MSIHRLSTSPLVHVRSTNFDGSTLPFPLVVRLSDGFAGTKAADVALQGSDKAASRGSVVDHRHLEHEAPIWAMLITHAGQEAADAWRAGFAFRDYSQPTVHWMLADTVTMRGRTYTLYSAEPQSDIAKALFIHADDQNVFRSITTSGKSVGHAYLHNELLRRRT